MFYNKRILHIRRVKHLTHTEAALGFDPMTWNSTVQCTTKWSWEYPSASRGIVSFGCCPFSVLFVSSIHSCLQTESAALVSVS